MQRSLLMSCRALGGALLAAALTAGCGGGGGGSATTTSATLSTPATAPTPSTPTVTPAGLITDRRTIPTPVSGRYPDKGESITDPVTGFVVTRMADAAELTGASSSLSAIVYSRFTPVNTTGEYVLVHGSDSHSAWIYRVADRKMMTILRFKPSLGASSSRLGEVNELRWDYSGSHPYRLYFVGQDVSNAQGGGERVRMSFYSLEFDPATGTHAAPVLIRDFSAAFPEATSGLIMNDVEGDSSNDSRYWAWQVMEPGSGGRLRTRAVFTYDKATDTILGSLQRSCATAVVPCAAIDTPADTAPYMTRPNMVEMSPLGTRVIVHFERAYAGNGDANIGTLADGPKAFLPDFGDPIRIGADATHSGWAWGAGGEELFVSQNNRNDWIEAVDIRNAGTARCSVIADNSFSCGTKLIRHDDLDPSFGVGFHFGKIYDRSKRGYIYMSTYAGNYAAWGLNQELLVAVRDGSGPAGPYFVRLGSTYNTTYDYRSEGAGALDFRGEAIWATANWGFSDGRGDAIRLSLPPNLFSLLPLF